MNCNQYCKHKLLSVRQSYLKRKEDGYLSDCLGYLEMYTAAFVNKFGTTDKATAKCLFSLEFSTQQIRISHEHHNTIISGAVVGGVVIVFYQLARRRKYARDRNDSIVNGSLYGYLFGWIRNKPSWPIRRKITPETARGIAYLHHGVYQGIIHRDIKASNILLDQTFEPKVADFGLAGIIAEATHLSTKVAVTFGYVAPEYALYGKLTERSDVYSFGVLLLEILSRRKAYKNNGGRITLFTDWAWELVNQGKASDVVDQQIPELGTPQEMEQYVILAILCCHPLLQCRPTMDQIVKILESDFQV